MPTTGDPPLIPQSPDAKEPQKVREVGQEKAPTPIREAVFQSPTYRVELGKGVSLTPEQKFQIDATFAVHSAMRARIIEYSQRNPPGPTGISESPISPGGLQDQLWQIWQDEKKLFLGDREFELMNKIESKDGQPVETKQQIIERLMGGTMNAQTLAANEQQDTLVIGTQEEAGKLVALLEDWRHDVKTPLTVAQAIQANIKAGKLNEQAAGPSLLKTLDQIDTILVGGMPFVGDEETFARMTATLNEIAAMRGEPPYVDEQMDISLFPKEDIPAGDITDMIEEAGDIYDNLRIVTNIDEFIAGFPISWNRQRAGSLIANIINDADKSYDGKGIGEKSQRLVEARIFMQGNNMVIQFRDHGKGFPQSMVEEWNKPVEERGEMETGFGEGIASDGDGLLRSEKILREEYGGRIEIENDRRDGGAITRIFIPLAE